MAVPHFEGHASFVSNTKHGNADAEEVYEAGVPFAYIEHVAKLLSALPTFEELVLSDT